MRSGWLSISSTILVLALFCGGCSTTAKLFGKGGKSDLAGPATATAPAPAPPVEVVIEPPPPPATAPVYSVSDFSADATGRVVLRQWPPIAATYANGSAVAGAVYFPTADEEAHRPDYQVAFIDAGRFIWSIVTLPYYAVKTPPSKDVVYHGAEQQAAIPGSEEDPIQPKPR